MEGIEAYRTLSDNLRYLSTFLRLYPSYRDYVNQPHKFQISARARNARAMEGVEILDAELQRTHLNTKKLARFLKDEGLVNVLDLEEDLELEYNALNQKFSKVFNAFSTLVEDVDYLKKAERREVLNKVKKTKEYAKNNES